MASSIQPINGTMIGGRGSIIDKSCAECPPLKPPVTEKEYTVPALEPGTQSVVVRNIDGQKGSSAPKRGWAARLLTSSANRRQKRLLRPVNLPMGST